MKSSSSVVYVCSECGREETKWMGRCPSCGSWNTFTEEKVIKESKDKTQAAMPIIDKALKKLSDVNVDKAFRFSSGISELDRVLGGGIMRPSSVLVGGEPGIGKSTIMLQMISSAAEIGKVLYVSGEESPSQVKLRAERLKLNLEKINIFCDTRLEALVEAVEDLKPAVVVVDSLQTLSTSTVPSIAGSPNQMRACCYALSMLAKTNDIALFLIGHVTKEGTIAGPKIVEHLVDTVLYFESSDNGVRFLRAAKNRFGSVDEIGIFQMEEEGLKAVKDPSEFFISNRKDSEMPAGIAYTAVVEGSRTFLVEIQALTIPAKSGFSRVYSDRIDTARVNRIAAILERHAGLHLSDQDIYVNIAGGMKINEVSIELAIALALWSARTETVLPVDLVSFGELSLAGEVRPVSFLEKRIKTSEDMGFKTYLSPYGQKVKGVTPCRNIKQAIMIGRGISKDN
ncbi:MAG: DNA repair protein RadA [Spirochaetales bacterium]|nr:DNA repair protein RadA [Spirochaetales bacterium]